ncbi:splicing regulator SDE2-like isoform X2 [Ostrea edulis]|uniref:splicing regulator SDE2-like isoform X2 n=1 Tax=Ostrea edulis TaxID=37623 RepID=UPI0020942FE8|nr:splicing regulator SDE2-like isoform X2 [Ostrea edulis]
MDITKIISDISESDINDFYITCNGKIVHRQDEIEEGRIYRIVPRVLGGKGGFGSMLRAIGAQIDKTNNREACRDLSGRRMRDVNNEKQLKDWVAKKAEKEKEREEKRKERMERRRALPNHKFDDPVYDKQRAVVAENLEDALQIGLQRAQTKQKASCTITSEEEAGPSGSGLKRKGDDKGGPCPKVKKHNEWLGIDIENLSDEDSDSNSDSEDQSEAACGSTDSEQAEKVNPEHKCTSDSDTGEEVTSVNSKETLQNPPETYTQTSSEKPEQDITDCQTDSSTSEPATEQSKKTEDDKPFDFDDYSSSTDLETLGLEKLKALLVERGMKCGGTLQQRAERLFSIKGLDPKNIDPTLLAKPYNGKGKGKK